MNVDIYTDGAARGNPGPGGYGAVLRCRLASGEVRELELSGGFSRTTNNRMELLGAITALEALKRPCAVTLYSDSQYVQPALGGRLAQARLEEREEGARQEHGPVEAPPGGQGAP